MFDKLTAERIEAVNQRGFRLQSEINDALKGFGGTLDEARKIADDMARDIYEVHVHEMIGAQRYSCSVRNYIGGRPG